MPELGLSPLVTQTLDSDYSWLWSPDMAYHFSGGLTINPARISVRLFSGLGYAPDPFRHKHFGVAPLTTPTLMQFYLSGVTVAVLDWWSALGAWCRGITITGVG